MDQHLIVKDIAPAEKPDLTAWMSEAWMTVRQAAARYHYRIAYVHQLRAEGLECQSDIALESLLETGRIIYRGRRGSYEIYAPSLVRHIPTEAKYNLVYLWIVANEARYWPVECIRTALAVAGMEDVGYGTVHRARELCFR